MAESLAWSQDGPALGLPEHRAWGLSTVAAPTETIVEVARLAAIVQLDRPFADAGDAFTTWLAYHRLLHQLRQVACRVMGGQHEVVERLRPWLEPTTLVSAPGGCAGTAWVRAAHLLERLSLASLSAGGDGDVDQRGVVSGPELQASLAQLLLILSACGEELAFRLTADAVAVGSAALRLEARRLRRHVPRLALAAVHTLENLRGESPRGGRAGHERPVPPRCD